MELNLFESTMNAESQKKKLEFLGKETLDKWKLTLLNFKSKPLIMTVVFLANVIPKIIFWSGVYFWYVKLIK